MTLTSSPPRAARRALRLIVAAVTLGGMVLAAPAFLSVASAQTDTPLSEAGWVASSNTNSSAGDAPQNAISGDTGARFSSDAAQASGMYWQVNMGSAQSFNQIEMDSGGYSTDYARGYNVEVSTNGTTFTSVATGTGTSSPETVAFATQTAQYIRVVLTQATSPSWWSMVNFTAYSVSLADGSTNIVLVNKDVTSGVNASVDTGVPVSAATGAFLLAPSRKRSIGRVAAPSATASGPKRPSSIEVCANWWVSECALAASRMAGSSRSPSSSPAQPPRMMRSGPNRFTRSAMPAPRYSAVSSRISADRASPDATSAASADSSSSPGSDRP